MRVKLPLAIVPGIMLDLESRWYVNATFVETKFQILIKWVIFEDGTTGQPCP